MTNEQLPRKERIHGRDLIDDLFAKGNMGVSGPVLVRALPNPSGQQRIGAVAGKKLGNAVMRNRMKRRLKAAYRTHKDEFPKNWDFFFVARRGLMEAPWTEVIQNMKRAAQQAITTHSGRRQPRRRE